MIIRMHSSCGRRISHEALSSTRRGVKTRVQNYEHDERTVNAELPNLLVDELAVGKQIPKEIGGAGFGVLAGSV